MREIADLRVHGTTGEPPRLRFDRDEAAALNRLSGRPPFRQIRELVRKVQSDCAIELDGNFYSVPWRLIGESLEVIVSAGRVCILHGGQQVAAHAESAGRRQRILDPAHFHGVVGAARPVSVTQPEPSSTEPGPALLRPLAEYELAAGGSWS
jgi:hypothetical protein